MLQRYRLVDVYVNERQEVVMVYKIGAREMKFVITSMKEAVKLKKYLEEIL